jgi:hypothetical protein
VTLECSHAGVVNAAAGKTSAVWFRAMQRHHANQSPLSSRTGTLLLRMYVKSSAAMKAGQQERQTHRQTYSQTNSSKAALQKHVTHT